MDPVTNTATGWLGGLTAYGPIGIMLAVMTVTGIYIVKKLFDSTLTRAEQRADNTLVKLDLVLAAVDRHREDVVNEIREMRHEFALAIANALARTPSPDNGSGMHGLPVPSLGPRKR